MTEKPESAFVEAADYLIDRYRSLWEGRRVRDLDEALVAYVSAKLALAAAPPEPLADMPTIWEDPAGKGYPCFERLMTPAEAKTIIERDGQLIASLENALEPFAAMRADDGDTFASYPPDMLVRCEVSVREILAARAALAALSNADADPVRHD